MTFVETDGIRHKSLGHVSISSEGRCSLHVCVLLLDPILLVSA